MCAKVSLIQATQTGKAQWKVIVIVQNLKGLTCKVLEKKPTIWFGLSPDFEHDLELHLCNIYNRGRKGKKICFVLLLMPSQP